MHTHSIHISTFIYRFVLCVFIYMLLYICTHAHKYIHSTHILIYTLYICIQGLIKYINQLPAISFTLILSKHLLAKILTVCIKCTSLVFLIFFPEPTFFILDQIRILNLTCDFCAIWHCTEEFTDPFIEVTFLVFSLLANSHRLISGNVLQNRIQ